MSELVPIAFGELAKFSLSIEPVGGLTPADYEYSIRLFVDERRFVEVTKSEVVEEEEGQLVFYADTRKVGVGIVLARIIAEIPDANAPDMVRRMEAVVATNSYIYR